MKSYAYGFPRLGEQREYKRIIENFWKEKCSSDELQTWLDGLQADILKRYEESVDFFPAGEMTGYDNMLDTAVMVGVHPVGNWKDYYELCRGHKALEMTKWFNTNYHYLATDFSAQNKPAFSLAWNKPQEYRERFKKGLPYIIGPFTFLKLSKGLSSPAKFRVFLTALIPVYARIIAGLPEVHIDEPALVLDLSREEIDLVKEIYTELGQKSRIHLFTYYDQVDCLKELYDLPLASLGLDFVHGEGNCKTIKRFGFPKDKTLVAGLVDGRNVWRHDFEKSAGILETLKAQTSQLIVSNAGPLYHLPLSVEPENLPKALKERLSFAVEKLGEIRALAQGTGKKSAKKAKDKTLGYDKQVRLAVTRLKADDFKKKMPFARRKSLHQRLLNLPLLPTTTIGSFPQTEDVRQARAEFRSGKMSEKNYRKFIDAKIRDVVTLQENLGLEVLVHGEFERTDMVEFFAQKLKGIATTSHGWVISYGTRVYRPPVIFGDIARPEAMTVREISVAQSLTKKPVKGMLTGPVTIIAWSFVREDIPLKEVAYQLALALREEIRDYISAGIKIVQVDEPAIREKAPLKHKQWPAYFDWAVKSFRLATNVDPQTQIHTHICYSEFNEILDYIEQMDFDVISIESARSVRRSRSTADIIAAFKKMDFKRQVGLGVWDIHSPVVPTVAQMKDVLQQALKTFPKEDVWINPDCGLKTRGWPETEASLKNIVELAQTMRKQNSN